jgi:uncharacterized membrane protein
MQRKPGCPIPRSSDNVAIPSPLFMPISCPDCAASMPESAAYCPGCGREVRAVERARGRVGMMSETVAGALAYFTFIPAAIFLLVEPYKKNRFVRFHSLQCIGLFLCMAILAAVMRIAAALIGLIPMLGPLLLVLISVILGLGFFILWLLLVVKALQGEMFQLPLIGDYAERQAANVVG